MGTRRSASLAGLVAGVAVGLLSLVIPVLGLVLGLLAVVGLLLRPPRAATFGGFLSGFGGTWILLLLRAQLDCAAFSRLPASECIAPSLDAWYLIGLGSLGMGVILSLISVRTALGVRRRSSERDR
jgi:hypothetical protein